MASRPNPDSIANCVLGKFTDLPQKYKPRELDNGRREWVPLAGIVLSRGNSTSLTCAALATGMKCLPVEKVTLANGNVLHDWHAEILAIRGFNRWLVDECADLAKKGFGGESAWLRWREQGIEGSDVTNEEKTHAEHSTWNAQPFALRDDVGIYMYCSEAPCGDASMELTMSEQEDATPWTSQPPLAADGTGPEMLGRGNFDQLGIVRRKPARPDAPATLSKSCSDKLALKQVTSLLSGLTSLLVHPSNAYLSQLILPESQCVRKAVQRAFGDNGRMSALAKRTWPEAGYAFKPFTVETTMQEFAFSKPRAGSASASVSNLSALQTPHRGEALINGVLQGRKQFDAKGASCVSRRKLWKSVLDVALLVGLPALTAVIKKRTYTDLKCSPELAERERVKRESRESALKRWKRNEGDAHWNID